MTPKLRGIKTKIKLYVGSGIPEWLAGSFLGLQSDVGWAVVIWRLDQRWRIHSMWLYVWLLSGASCRWENTIHSSSHGPLHRATWVSSHMIADFPGREHSRKQDWGCIAFNDLTKEITHCSYCHFLLVTALSRIMMIPQRCPKTVELGTMLSFMAKGNLQVLLS